MPAAKITPELVAAICAELRTGKPRRAAAAACGIHRDTLDGWLQLGKRARANADEGVKLSDRDRLYADTVDAVELALDEGESFLYDLTLEYAANPKDGRWQAPMTLLERTRADIYQRRRLVEHGTPDGKPFPVGLSFDPSKLDNDELDVMRALLEKAQPQED